MNQPLNDECVVKMSGVSKSFGSHLALDNISLAIPRGVVFALLGENGAGKSTCLKTLLGLQRADQGESDVLGMDSRTRGVDIRATVGYVPENPALYDWMTVAEIGWFTAGFYGAGFQSEFERLAAEYELPLTQRIGKLSKGGRAKVTLALATAHQPPLLIMDEPTSGLDTLVRRKFLESMVDVAASGRTVLLSSHQIPEVERVADTIAIIHRGKLLVCDSLENLKQSMEQWVVTLAALDVSLPDIKAEIVLHEGQRTRRQRLLVRNMSPDCLWQMRDQEGIQEVEVNTPSLEEIFVGLMKSNHDIGSERTNDDTNESTSRSAEVSP